MGIWSAAIFGNDSSCEVKEYFFEQYNTGKLPEEIKCEIVKQYNLNDEEEKYNILFALAYCLWQTKALDDTFLLEIKELVSNNIEQETLRKMGADKSFLTARNKSVKKLLADISVPKASAKRRVKPPVPVDSQYRNGCILAFQYSDGYYGAAIVVDSQFFKRKAMLYYAITDVHTKCIPTIEEAKKSHLIDDGFDKYKMLHLYGCHSFNSKNIKFLEEYNNQFFKILGYIPEWKNAYRSSSSGRYPYEQGSYDNFTKVMHSQFDFKYKSGAATEMTVDEITLYYEN